MNPPSAPGLADTKSRVRAAESAGTDLDVRLQKHHAAKDAAFTLEAEFRAVAGFTILFGASGAGKTTLLDCIAGLAMPEGGRIAVGDRALFDSSQGINVTVAKRRIGYVFQDLALFPHMTVEQNVLYGLSHLPRAERKERGLTVLRSFRIAHLANRNAKEISGGESQRVTLARTLVTDPEVLLLDEPLAALDGPTRAQIIDDLRKWNRAHAIPILYVTHSREEVFALGERVLVLDSGRIVAEGTPHEVMTAPALETVAHLVGFENVFDVVAEAMHPERGTMLCRIVVSASASHGSAQPVLLETPLVRAEIGSNLRVGIRAGDILLATSPPSGLSARNVIRAFVVSLEQRDVIVVARVSCGTQMEVHLTLAARDSLELKPGREVWLVIKTHSCHLMQR